MTMRCVRATELAHSVLCRPITSGRSAVPVVAHKLTAIVGPIYQSINTAIMAFVLVIS